MKLVDKFKSLAEGIVEKDQLTTGELDDVELIKKILVTFTLFSFNNLSLLVFQ